MTIREEDASHSNDKSSDAEEENLAITNFPTNVLWHSNSADELDATKEQFDFQEFMIGATG